MKDLEQARMLLAMAQKDCRALAVMCDPDTVATEIFGLHVQVSEKQSLAKIIAGVRGGSSPPAGFGAAPQGFVFEFKQKAPFTVFDFDFCPKGIMSSKRWKKDSKRGFAYLVSASPNDTIWMNWPHNYKDASQSVPEAFISEAGLY